MPCSPAIGSCRVIEVTGQVVMDVAGGRTAGKPERRVLRKRGDFWKIAVVALAVMMLATLIRP